MRQRYEYQFVRLGEGMLGVKKWAKEDYPNVVQKYAEEGWRLIQIFAPGTAIDGSAKYYELIFERVVDPGENG